MKIICPVTSDDVIAEGQMLHHCVGTYVHRIVNGECVAYIMQGIRDVLLREGR